MTFFKHDTSIIDDGAEIGAGSKIWHWTHISSGAIIGTDCSLGQNVFIGNAVSIGNGCKIQNNVSVYDNITLEDFVFCGPSVVFTNVLNPRSEILRKNEYRTTIIRKGATLGANSTIVCGNEIGNYAFIGAGTTVTKAIKPFSLVVGCPSHQIGWMSKEGHRLDLPLYSCNPLVRTQGNSRYTLTGSNITCEDL